jgi:hypothetical protein
LRDVDFLCNSTYFLKISAPFATVIACLADKSTA